jgi:hypothetical protein
MKIGEKTRGDENDEWRERGREGEEKEEDMKRNRMV